MGIKTIIFSLLLATAPAWSADGKDLQFSPSDWDPALFDLLRAGPSLLPRDTEIKLPAPPAATSAATSAEIAILKLRKAYDRTPETIALIQSEGDPSKSVLDAFEAQGYLPDLAAVEGLEAFLTAATGEARWFVLSEKWKYQRARPTQVDPRLEPVLAVPGHASYPSGHATESRALALVLAKLDPACAGAYLSLAEAIGDRREIAGLHFPSDSRAGELLADQVIRMVLEGPLARELGEQRLKAEAWRAPEGACPHGS